MNTKVIVFGCLIVGVVFCMAYKSSRADSDIDIANTKIAVVSIQKIFQQCETNAKYIEQATAEQNQVVSELDKLSKEIEAQKAGLITLKSGTSDHLGLMQEMLRKQGELEAQREFAKQRIALKDLQWTVKLYKDILRIVNELAQQKGFDLVLERNEPESLDFSSINELMATIRTHKVLYGGGCQDISDEVIARLDVGK